jgi:hypothetical protein
VVGHARDDAAGGPLEQSRLRPATRPGLTTRGRLELPC